MDPVVKPRAWMLLYLATVVAITFIHAPGLLATLLIVAIAASGTRRWKLLRRALVAILAINGIVLVVPDYLVIKLVARAFQRVALFTVEVKVFEVIPECVIK